MDSIQVDFPCRKRNVNYMATVPPVIVITAGNDNCLFVKEKKIYIYENAGGGKR